MIFTRRHITVLVSAAMLAGPVLAQGDDPAAVPNAWYQDRARFFSDVCMASAPEFATLKERALAAGFKDVDGKLTYPPEVSVSLRDSADRCACSMIMGAPEPGLMLAGVVDRLRADYPGVYRPDEREGPGYYAFYQREGVDVRLELNIEEFKGVTFVAGFVIAQGACAT